MAGPSFSHLSLPDKPAGQYFGHSTIPLVYNEYSSSVARNPGVVPVVIGVYVPPLNMNNYQSVKYNTNSEPSSPNFKLELIRDDTRYTATINERKDIAAQVQAMKNLPELALLVNPSSIKTRHERPSDITKSRRSNVVSMWLEKMIVLTFEGKTSGQYVIRRNNGKGGLTGSNRIFSASYENLLSLINIYRNNGILYRGYDASNGSAGTPITAGSVYITYGRTTYVGSFNNFTLNDSSDSPHNMGYSFEFTSRYEFESEATK